MTMSNYTPISMPSLGKIFDMMKSLPPQQAAQDINSPDPAKKLAAMMVTNSDKQLQQQQAAQQQPMPTIAQKLSQGVTQAPGAPTPPMPAVPPQAQAKPAAQGIAALQPQQTPPGSAMGILPTQQAPEVQAAPQQPVQRSTGGIASFAAGGQAQASQQQAQKAQQLAQLMQAINQSNIVAAPQQDQQAGVAAPQPGQANPMQNYSSMVFGTRPQYRPGTEAAPISQDLSLSQMGQYSPQQPIAAAHGGLMHHVPDHLYKFAQGGILAFAGKEGSQANLTQAQLEASLADSTGNPGILKQPAIDMAGRDLYDVPFDSAGQNTAPGVNIDPNAVNVQSAAATGNPGIIPGNTLAQAAQAAGNTYTGPTLDTGVQPHVRGNVASPFQGVYDAVGNFFSNQGTAATNPRLGGTSATPVNKDEAAIANAQAPSDMQSNAAALMNNRNALMGNQAAPSASAQPSNTGIASQTIPNPLQLTSPATQQPQQQAQQKQPAPAPVRPTGIAAVAPTAPAAPSKYDTLDAAAAKIMENRLNNKPQLKDAWEENDAILKHEGLDTPAGQVALKKLEEIQQMHNENKKKNEINDLISVMRGWGVGGPGGAADVYTGLQRQHQAEDEKRLWQQLEVLDDVDKRNREEKLKRGDSVSKIYADSKKEQAEAASKIFGEARTSERDKNRIASEENRTKWTIEAEKDRELLRQAFEAKYKDLTPEQIMQKAKTDPSFLTDYAKVKAAMSGQGSKLDMTGATAMLRAAQSAFDKAKASELTDPNGKENVEAAARELQESREVIKRLSRGEEPYPAGEKSVVMAPPVPTDKSKLIAGHKYTGANGVVAVWNGTKFVAE